MSTILDTIVAERRSDVREAKAKRRLSELEEKAQGQSRPKPFAAIFPERGAAGQGPFRVIAEIKKASPSKGLLRADFRPREIALSYEKHGAGAISVLTEERRFQGSLDHLSEVARAVQIPLLRKDFFVDPYQVVEARAHGASAILIIVACTARSLALELLAAAGEYSLDVLAEIHDRKELDEVLSWGKPAVVGVNNRDLHTFEVSLDTSLELLPHVPANFRAVAESGIATRADMEKLAAAGAGGFLIGETFMRAKDPGEKLAELLETP